MEIRPARPQEYEATGRLAQSAYREFAGPGDPLRASYFASLADVAGRARHARVLVAVEVGRILGTATLELDHAIDGERLPPNEANLGMLAVASEVGGREVGRRLVAACIAGAREAAKHLVTLHWSGPGRPGPADPADPDPDGVVSGEAPNR